MEIKVSFSAWRVFLSLFFSNKWTKEEKRGAKAAHTPVELVARALKTLHVSKKKEKSSKLKAITDPSLRRRMEAKKYTNILIPKSGIFSGRSFFELVDSQKI